MNFACTKMCLLRIFYAYSVVFAIATLSEAASPLAQPSSITSKDSSHSNDDTTNNLPGRLVQHSSDSLTATESCSSIMGLGIRWPLTPKGATAVEQCLHNTEGFAHWTCGDTSPPRWDGFPNITQCTSSWMHDIRQKADRHEKPENLAEELVCQISKNVITSAADLWSAVDLLTEIAMPGPTVVDDTKDTSVEKLTNQVLKAGSNLLDVRHNTSWVELGEADRAETATALIAALETTSLTLAESVSSGAILTSLEKNIGMSVGKFQTAQMEGKVTLPPHNDTVDSIQFTAGALQNQGLGNMVKVVFLAYSNVGPYLDSVPAGMVINSKVITAAVNDMHRPGRLKIPVTITLEHIAPANGRSVCAFWDYKADTAMNFHGVWSTRGCMVVRSDSQKTVCQCEHLANFAVLMNVTDTMGARISNIQRGW
ncbi:adhesion G protein-coupled receptor L3-like [Paramacrobiotus metropolitanus]|uniref:adhesion G protein-coupled receptor L3-like n=1 Tax=Paramacrobiotus metropolitanus TaxID=2943436 RepID=UPI002445D613|nr:adhesion G protein-coupled receptor L3-like [Paramacrobiotus metropolitanus]